MQAIPGGAAGVPAALNEVPRFQPEVLRQEEGDRYRQPRRYMVVDGPRDASSGKVRYNDPHCGLVTLSPGKEVTENSHNLAGMRAQGIRLEVIPDIVEDEPAPELEAAPEETPPADNGEGKEQEE
jgi:hypothetical protein